MRETILSNNDKSLRTFSCGHRPLRNCPGTISSAPTAPMNPQEILPAVFGCSEIVLGQSHRRLWRRRVPKKFFSRPSAARNCPGKIPSASAAPINS